MRQRKTFVFGLMVALTACTTATTVSTTTTSTSTTTSITTTTTTTTVQATTTTVASTTMSHLEGNWANQPLIAYDDWGGMALGWWDGSDWVQVDADTTLPVTGGEDYQVALLGSEAVLEGGPPGNHGCDVVFPEGLPGVQFDDGNALYTIVDDGNGGERSVSGIAISTGWKAFSVDTTVPRPPSPVTHPTPHHNPLRLTGLSNQCAQRRVRIVECTTPARLASALSIPAAVHNRTSRAALVRVNSGRFRAGSVDRRGRRLTVQ